MPILDAEYIKEQAHKQCFWSEEYGFDVVAFTHAMEQNYSNRIGSKINSLKKKITELETELATLKAENESLRKDAERYRFLKDTPWSANVSEVICHHQNAAWDNVIDAAMAQGERG